MKKAPLFNLIILIVFPLFFFSCTTNENFKGSIQLGIDDKSTLKSLQSPTDKRIPVAAYISVKDEDSHFVLNMKRLPLIKMGNKFLTEHIEFEIGTYTVVDFIVVDRNDSVVFLTPKRGSELENLVRNPLPIEFEVYPDDNTGVLLEVVSAIYGEPEEFGYATFFFMIREKLPQNGLLAYYMFEGNANDTSGNDFHGNAVNVSYLNFNEDRNDDVAIFNGRSHIQLPVDFDYPTRTVSIWFNAQDISSTVQRLYYSDHPDLEFGSTNMDIAYNETEGYYFLRMECGGGDAEDLNIPIEENVWYNATLTIGADSVKAYLNGELYGVAAINYHSSIDGDQNAFVGCNRNLDKYFYKGMIDDLLIYNRELCPREVKLIYLLNQDTFR